MKTSTPLGPGIKIPAIIFCFWNQQKCLQKLIKKRPLVLESSLTSISCVFSSCLTFIFIFFAFLIYRYFYECNRSFIFWDLYEQLQGSIGMLVVHHEIYSTVLFTWLHSQRIFDDCDSRTDPPQCISSLDNILIKSESTWKFLSTLFFLFFTSTQNKLSNGQCLMLTPTALVWD